MIIIHSLHLSTLMRSRYCSQKVKTGLVSYLPFFRARVLCHALVRRARGEGEGQGAWIRGMEEGGGKGEGIWGKG